MATEVAGYLIDDLSAGASLCARTMPASSFEWPTPAPAFAVLRSVEASAWRPLPAEIVGTIRRRTSLGHIDVERATTIDLRRRGADHPLMECDLTAASYEVWMIVYGSAASSSRRCRTDSVEIVLARGGSLRAAAADDGSVSALPTSVFPLMPSLSDRGFVVCDEEALTSYARRTETASLLQRFVETEDGDELLRIGAVVPFMGMNPWTYRIALARGDARDWPAELVGTNAGIRRCYRLRATTGVVAIFDGQALYDWPSREDSRLGTVPWEGDRLVSMERFDLLGPHDDHTFATHVLADVGPYRGEPLDEPWINLGPFE